MSETAAADRVVRLTWPRTSHTLKRLRGGGMRLSIAEAPGDAAAIRLHLTRTVTRRQRRLCDRSGHTGGRMCGSGMVSISGAWMTCRATMCARCGTTLEQLDAFRAASPVPTPETPPR